MILSTGTEGLVPNASRGKFFVVLDRTDGVPFTFLGIRLIGDVVAIEPEGSKTV